MWLTCDAPGGRRWRRQVTFTYLYYCTVDALRNQGGDNAQMPYFKGFSWCAVAVTNARPPPSAPPFPRGRGGGGEEGETRFAASTPPNPFGGGCEQKIITLPTAKRSAGGVTKAKRRARHWPVRVFCTSDRKGGISGRTSDGTPQERDGACAGVPEATGIIACRLEQAVLIVGYVKNAWASLWPNPLDPNLNRKHLRRSRQRSASR